MICKFLFLVLVLSVVEAEGAALNSGLLQDDLGSLELTEDLAGYYKEEGAFFGWMQYR